MVDAVTAQTLQDADDYAVIHLTSVSDGSGESAVLKVDVSTLDASGRNAAACNGVDIIGIQGNAQGMAVKLLWDADTDVTAAVVQGTLDMDFTRYPLTNNAGAGKTGDILLTTVAHTSGDSYDITLKLRKKYAS